MTGFADFLQRGHISLARSLHPNSEVKQVRAGVVLRWGTTREGPVLRFLFHFRNPFYHVFRFATPYIDVSTMPELCRRAT